ncbi:MAG: N-formylglutamate amidohydrolase [Syntrophotaleaceae bacterium]
MTESGFFLLFSCEHGGNQVPPPWTRLFQGQESLLETHRGYDIGVALLARRLAGEMAAPLHLALVSRLLVELNRSLGHPALFSEFSRTLDPNERQALLQEFYHPYRDAVIRDIEQALKCRCRVCHISVHSFAPQLHGQVRNADIGLLYDPQRRREKGFCLNWQKNIQQKGEGWRVRRNYPYRGSADGFVTSLRRRFAEEHYLGIELELNQLWPLHNEERWQALQQLIGATLQETLLDQARSE